MEIVVRRELVVLNDLIAPNCVIVVLPPFTREATCNPERHAMAARPPQLFREAAIVNCDTRTALGSI